MPRATVNLDTVQKELETLEGGFVVLRPMSYGQILERQDMMMLMQMNMQEVGGDRSMDIKMMAKKAAYFDFAKCVADHNCENADGMKLDLTQPSAIDSLDPRIGQEIGKLIDELNQIDEKVKN